MNIGIIVYSQTGNTYSVALKIREKLLAAGHLVTVERLGPVGEQRFMMGDVLIEAFPAIDEYDALLLGSPVQAFGLAPAMKQALGKLPDLGSRKVACFVTMAFPFAWLGGNAAISKLRQACAAKNGTVIATGIVNWSFKRTRDQRIEAVASQLAGSL